MIEPGDKVDVTLRGMVTQTNLGTPDNPVALVIFDVFPTTDGTWKGLKYLPMSELKKVDEETT